MVYSQNLTSVMENMLVHLHTRHICIYVYLEEHFKTLLGIFFTSYFLQDLFPSDVSMEKYQCTGFKQLCLQSSYKMCITSMNFNSRLKSA